MPFFSGVTSTKHWLLNPVSIVQSQIIPLYIFHFSENCLPSSSNSLQFSCSQLMRSRWHLMLLNVRKNLLAASPQLHFNTVRIYYFTEFHLLCHLGIYEYELTDVQCNKEYQAWVKHVWHLHVVISGLRSLALDHPKSCLPIHLTYLVSSSRTCWKVTHDCLLISY